MTKQTPVSRFNPGDMVVISYEKTDGTIVEEQIVLVEKFVSDEGVEYGFTSPEGDYYDWMMCQDYVKECDSFPRNLN